MRPDFGRLLLLELSCLSTSSSSRGALGIEFQITSLRTSIDGIVPRMQKCRWQLELRRSSGLRSNLITHLSPTILRMLLRITAAGSLDIVPHVQRILLIQTVLGHPWEAMVLSSRNLNGSST